jgi:hypothetical protein
MTNDNIPRGQQLVVNRDGTWHLQNDPKNLDFLAPFLLLIMMSNISGSVFSILFCSHVHFKDDLHKPAGWKPPSYHDMWDCDQYWLGCVIGFIAIIFLVYRSRKKTN